MTARDDHGRSQDALAAPRQKDGGTARRPRTAYLWYRRYQQLEPFALLLGGSCGLFVSGYALLPPLLAGEPVTRSLFLVAIALVAVAALMPFALVRWRWRALRRQLAQD